MRAFSPLPCSCLALVVALLLGVAPASAQTGGRPSLPPGPVGGNVAGGSGDYRISSSSNEHGTSLWVVDSVQHTVTLCEKVDTAKEFTCSKKPLP